MCYLAECSEVLNIAKLERVSDCFLEFISNCTASRNRSVQLVSGMDVACKLTVTVTVVSCPLLTRGCQLTAIRSRIFVKPQDSVVNESCLKNSVLLRHHAVSWVIGSRRFERTHFLDLHR
jgi:hypothetical protein